MAAAELLQVKALEKEQNRIAGIRARNQERLQRILNARQRTIGLDTHALDAQIEEKRRLKEAEKQADMLEAARTRKIVKVLEATEEKDRLARKALMAQHKAEWEQQQSLLLERKNKPTEPHEVPEACGMASLQRLAGEDQAATERRRFQAQQMRAWVQQQMEEKRIRSLVDAAEDNKYADFLKEITGIAQEQEKDEMASHKALTREIQRQNQAAAAQNAEHRAALSTTRLREDKELLDRVNSDPMLNEANDYALPVSAKVRRDHFRGFTQPQRNQIFKENSDLIRERAENRDDLKYKEMVYAAQQDAWRKALERQDWDENAQRKQLAYEEAQALVQQRVEQKARSEKAKRDAFGQIGRGFYDGFGKSCR